MKNLLILIMIVAFALVSFSAVAKTLPSPNLMLVSSVAEGDTGPDVVVYDKAKMGVSTFDHKGHSAKVDCVTCHGDGAPAKVVIDKKAAHGEACKDCHKAQGGPTKCKGCHVKQ